MLTATTIDGLKALRLDAMAAALAEQCDQPGYAGLGFEDRLGLLVDHELTERSNRRMERCLKTARLRAAATVEDIDFRHPRGLDRAQVLALAQAHWVASHQAVLITGPTGAGKTYLACALAHAAIRHGHTALYLRAPRMLDDLAIARADGRLSRLLAAWARIGVLILDDLLLRPLTSDQAADLLEVIEDRARLRATIITSQLPVALWHQAIADPTIADAILARIAALYAIEKEIRGQSAEIRQSVRSDRTRPLVAELEAFLRAQAARLSSQSAMGKAIAYLLNHWSGLILFLDDGRLEMDTNPVENQIRPLTLTRKNALFAGHDEGGRSWSRIASVIATCKLNQVEPYAWMKATLEAIADGHPQSRIDELLPWAARPAPAAR